MQKALIISHVFTFTLYCEFRAKLSIRGIPGARYPEFPEVFCNIESSRSDYKGEKWEAQVNDDRGGEQLPWSACSLLS